MAISVINIARNSLRFTSVNFLAALASGLVMIYVATILVPEEYGVYGFLGLWLMYAGLIGPGISSAGYREMPVLLGKGDEEEALRIQNISITGEMLYSIAPFSVILGASFFFSDPVIKLGLVIIAISYIASRFAGYWEMANFYREKFGIVTKGRLIKAVLPSLAILATVSHLRVYALIVAPIIGAMACGVYYWRRGPISYRFMFDRAEVIRLVKVGVILQAATLAFWGFRMADRTIIASMFPFEQLGLYVFAAGFIMYARTLIGDFINVMQPILWRETGKAGSAFDAFKDTKRIGLYVALGASIVIPITQLLFYLVVSLITTNYVDSIPVFYVLSYGLYFIALCGIPSLILNSSIVNKQKLFLYIYLVGLALNIVFDILVIRLGYGVVGVAWVTVCTQGLVTFILYRFIRGYIFKDIKEFLGFQLRIIVPFLVTVPFYFLHNYLSFMASSIWAFAGISVAAQVTLWSLVIRFFCRDYLSINDIKTLMREIKAGMIPGRKSG